MSLLHARLQPLQIVLQPLLLFFSNGPVLLFPSLTAAKNVDFVAFLPALDPNLRFLLPRIARRGGPNHLFPVVVVFEFLQPGIPLRLSAGYQVVVSASLNLWQVLLIR